MLCLLKVKWIDGYTAIINANAYMHRIPIVAPVLWTMLMCNFNLLTMIFNMMMM